MAKVFKPNTIDKTIFKSEAIRNYPKIFLGGTIDMGNSDDWQSQIEKELDDFNCIILNPRRTDWDSSWEQTPTPGTPFFEQVDWELKGQEASDCIIYNFLPSSRSPITLLELGLFITGRSTLFVVCPKEYFRYGNVKIVCEQQGVKFFYNQEDMLEALKIYLSEWEFLKAVPPAMVPMENENDQTD